MPRLIQLLLILNKNLTRTTDQALDTSPAVSGEAGWTALSPDFILQASVQRKSFWLHQQKSSPHFLSSTRTKNQMSS